MNWIYEHTPDNTARFVLGTVGERPLICFGINPSTAEPNKLDPTVNYVSRLAVAHGYDSFIMLNVYPQRATNPNDLHLRCDPSLRAENETQIARLIDGVPHTIWVAWGGLIRKRPYLLPLAERIVCLPALAQCRFLSRGMPTKDGHPHHPLYIKKEELFAPFDMEAYLRVHSCGDIFPLDGISME